VNIKTSRHDVLRKRDSKKKISCTVRYSKKYYLFEGRMFRKKNNGGIAKVPPRPEKSSIGYKMDWVLERTKTI